MATTARRSSSIAGSEKPASLYDSARGSPEPQHPTLDCFHALIDDINRILGSSNGIDSESVDVEDLVQAMEEYHSDEAQWSKYAFSDANRAYTRNLIDRGNGKANLLVSEEKMSFSRAKHTALYQAAIQNGIALSTPFLSASGIT